MNRLASLTNKPTARSSKLAALAGGLLDTRLLSKFDPAALNNIDEAREVLVQAERLIEEQQKRIKQLENLALTDELTSLVNRRGLMSELKRELAVASRDKAGNGVLVLCDLDGFKKINDTYGHLAGDAYLQAVAATLSHEVRSSDVVARIGGDEFAVLLTRVEAATGLLRATKLERAFNTRMMQWQGRTLPLRASFGFSVYTGTDVPETLLSSADLKLYAQKTRAKALR
ncbi:MAG: diguanylate cyclase [Alphaproteobacteria bacterium]|nr:diguanylate cyclase [Alphaproteobacteria bacterium]